MCGVARSALSPGSRCRSAPLRSEGRTPAGWALVNGGAWSSLKPIGSRGLRVALGVARNWNERCKEAAMLRLSPLQAAPRTDLSAWPEVAARLSGRVWAPALLAGEAADDFENRVSTALMALYRDAREPRCFEALYSLAGPGVLT